MMRWKYIELQNGEYPTQVATKHGSGWVILQQEVTVYRYESEKYFAGNYTEWQDVPLHIESKE